MRYVLLLVCMFCLGVPQVQASHSSGILDGDAPTDGSPGGEVLTDGNHSTYTTMYISNYYRFDIGGTSIDRWMVDAEISGGFVVRFYDASGNLIGTENGTTGGMITSTSSVYTGVEYVIFDQTYNNGYKAYEFNLYSSDTTPPAVPQNVAATEGANEITISWDAVPDIDLSHYLIYRDGTQIASTSSTTYTDSGLIGGSTYSYTVASVDAAGNESGQSSIVTATAQIPDTTPPSIPTLRTGTKVGGVELFWRDGGESDLAGFFLYRDGVLLAQLNQNDYTDTAVNYGQSYTYTVTAYDTSGNESGHSASVTASPAQPYVGLQVIPPNMTFGFGGSDIILNTLAVVGPVAALVLLGAAFYFSDKLITLLSIATAAFGKKSKGVG